MLLEGLFPPITSCFYADGRPYWRKLEQNVERYSLTPLHGLTLLGSTGEAVMLSDEETRETFRIARQAVSPDKVLIAGIGRESVIETLRLAEHAARLEYDVVLVRTPHFFRGQMRDREMRTYYQAVADRSPLPVLLYNVPPCTAYDLPVSVVADLAHHPNILGLKDSSGDVARIARIVESTRGVKKRTVTVTPVFAAVTSRMLAASTTEEGASSFVAADQLGSGMTAVAQAPPRSPMPTRTREVGFQVLCGSAQTFYDSLEAGATGGVIAMADFVPQAFYEIYAAWKENDTALATEKQNRVLKAGDEICRGMGIPGIKYALDFNGYFGGHPRMPLLPITAEEQRTVQELLRDLRN